jgi:hypothetical protein
MTAVKKKTTIKHIQPRVVIVARYRILARSSIARIAYKGREQEIEQEYATVGVEAGCAKASGVTGPPSPSGEAA